MSFSSSAAPSRGGTTILHSALFVRKCPAGRGPVLPLHQRALLGSRAMASSFASMPFLARATSMPSLPSITGYPTATLCRARVASVSSASGGSTATLSQSRALAPSEPLQPKHGVVIVGGGPAGLAAALALAVAGKWTEITVVEKNPDLVLTDAQRSYAIGVTGRSLSCAELFGVAEELKAAGFDTPSVSLTEVRKDGTTKEMRRPYRDPTKISYLMTRPTFVRVLAARVEQHNQQATQKEEKISVLTSSRVVRMEKVPDYNGEGERVAVVVEGPGGTEQVLYPSLVVGSDGMNSIVRVSLQEWAEREAHPGSSTFALKKYPAPSAGLCIKAFRIPRELALKSGEVIGNHTFGAVEGTYRGVQTFLGIYPVKDELLSRTASIVTKPGHPLREIPLGDTAGVRAALREAFPQIDLESQVSDEDLAKFASSKGTTFPVPQAADGLAYTLKGSHGRSSAVVLVGDAAHCFPPDLGQGINAAMQDVQTLVTCLERAGDDVASAARAYSDQQAPEADALARLVAYGNPYQYRQDYWKSKLYFFGFVFRIFLSKVLGFLGFDPPPAFLGQDVSLRYSNLLKREMSTRWKITMLFSVPAILVIVPAVRSLVK